MKNTTLLKVGATSLITLSTLGLALTTTESKGVIEVEDNLAYKSDYAIRNHYTEIVALATDNVEYNNVIEEVKRKVEEDERIKREQEDLERKLKEELERNNLGEFNVSWYTAKCEGCTGVTATGVDVKNTIYYKGYQIAASDWNIIPPNSIIEVEGYGQFIVIDKGGAIKHRKLDLLTSSKQIAYSNGRQNLNVKVIKWGE